MNLREISLRAALEDDFSAIKDLVREGQINPMGLDWQRFIVAVTQENIVIGCGQIKPHRDGTNELASIVVTKKWRKLGIAKMIIEELMRGYEGELYLMCQSSLGTIYEKYQFVALNENEMPKYFRRINKLVGFVEPLRKSGETLLVMKKTID